MPRVQPKEVSPQERRALLDALWTMVALLESREEVEHFFQDLLSDTEALMLARRVKIASLLLQGKSYDAVCGEMKTSPVTIASVHRWLQMGQGYQNQLPKLEAEYGRREKIRERDQQSKEPFSPEWMKKKYPLHFFLFNLLDDRETRPPKKLRKKSPKSAK